MRRWIDDVRGWVPFGLIAGVLAASAAGVAWSRHDFARAERELAERSRSAARTASELRRRCVSQAECARMAALRREQEERLVDLDRPARVVAALSETCRRCGAEVLEIAPVAAARRGEEQAAEPGARYRLVVNGTYRQLAEVLDGCARQRLPAAVVEFSIGPCAGERPNGLLRGEVIVECFDPRWARGKGTRA